MTTKSCPACGAQTSGKFCSECGAPLSARSCPKCNAEMSARAKFCPECGFAAPGAAAGRSGASAAATGQAAMLPWIVAGVAVVALLATLIVVVTRRPAGVDTAAAAAPFAPGQRATTDISNMTPREQADRLFNRVMQASTNGDTAQVQFFGPMTINAYGMMDSLDPDARLHLGMVQLVLGNTAAVLAQADSIARGARTHLFGSLLRARAAEARADAALARQAYREFLANWDAERARNLPEYQQHDADLQQLRTAAQAGR